MYIHKFMSYMRNSMTNILLCRFIIAISGTLIVAFLCKNIYQSKVRYVDLEIALQYENQANNHWQIFYREGGQWKPLEPEQMQNCGQATQKITFPCEALTALRIDFNSPPGNIELSKINLHGKERITLNDMTVRYKDQVTQSSGSAGKLTLKVNDVDSRIILDLNNILKGKKHYDHWNLAILAFSVFIIILALTRLAGQIPAKSCCIVNGIFALFFLIALFIPASKINKETVSATENRNLAVFPPLLLEAGKINYQFGKNFEAWFNDHFRGRSALLDLDTYIFQKTRSPLQVRGNAYLGFENWHFLYGDEFLRNYHNLDLFSQKELAQAADDLNAINALCRKKGKKLYFVITPDKHKIYGEYFPAAPKIHPDSQSRARQLVHHVNTCTEVPVFYLQDTLLANKNRGILYWKYDTHWTPLGSYYGYLELMKYIQKDFPDIYIDNISALEPATVSDADMNSRNIPEDNTNYLVPVHKANYTTSKITRSIMKQNNPAGKYNVLILRDSFATALLPYMGNSFKNITAFWTMYELPARYVKEFEESDIVIFECVERLLPCMLNGIHITRLNLEKGVK